MIPVSSVDNSIIDNAGRFMNFLSSDTVRPIRSTLSIIPSVVSKIMDLALERKRLAVQENDSKRKAAMFQDYLSTQDRISKRELQYKEKESIRGAALQDRESQRRYALEIERIRAEADSIMEEINYRRETAAAGIQANMQVRLEAIRAGERVRIEEIRLQYELK